MRPGVQEATWRGNVQGNHSPAPLKEWYATLAQMTGLHHWKGINVCCRKPLSFWWFVTAAWDTLRHIFCQSMEHLKCESEVTQSCPTLGDPMSCSLPGSSVHGIFQATGLEWVAVSFSRGSCQPRDRTRVSRTAGRHFTVWATREAPMEHLGNN